LIVVLGALYGWALEPSAEPEETHESLGDPGVLVGVGAAPTTGALASGAEAGSPTVALGSGAEAGSLAGGPDAGNEERGDPLGRASGTGNGSSGPGEGEA
jgi:hypothetical protein